MVDRGGGKKTAFLTIDEALKVTNRRVNALENVTIPRIEETLAYINKASGRRAAAAQWARPNGARVRKGGVGGYVAGSGGRRRWQAAAIAAAGLEADSEVSQKSSFLRGGRACVHLCVRDGASVCPPLPRFKSPGRERAPE